MPSAAVEIETSDGKCPATLFRPDGAGPWPAVIMYMDGIGMRPAMRTIAARISEQGYVVLLPDLFYRAGPYETPDPHALFADPEVRKAWFAKVRPASSQANTRRDTAAFLDLLSKQAAVRQGAVGVVGYCMGGTLAVAMAGFYPERILAAAAYHPGNLATDEPESPHLLAPRMNRALRLYVAAADQDASFPPEMQRRFEQALVEAKLTNTVETYPGARHGFAPSDTPAHDPAAAERHFQTLFELFKEALA